MQQQKDVQLIIKLKKEVKRQGGIKRNAETELELTRNNLIKSWKKRYNSICDIEDYMDLEEEIWQYLLQQRRPSRQINSQKLGIVSIIGEYTNKKGITSKAHFTMHGRYLGSVAKFGTEPIFYDGWFPVDRDNWYINLSYFNNETDTTDWMSLFEPKNETWLSLFDKNRRNRK
jgi:hypothetical protein